MNDSILFKSGHKHSDADAILDADERVALCFGLVFVIIPFFVCAAVLVA